MNVTEEAIAKVMLPFDKHLAELNAVAAYLERSLEQVEKDIRETDAARRKAAMKVLNESKEG